MEVSVVVDTTELFRVPLLNAAGWPELLMRCRRGQLALLVPEVVLREAARHFRTQAGNDFIQAQKAMSRLRARGVESTPDLQGTASELDELVDAYRPHLEEVLLEHGCQYGLYPISRTRK